MSALSLAGGPIGTVLLAFIVALLLFLRRAFVAIAAVIASVGLGLALDTLLKLVIHRPRPYLWPHTVAEHSYSFPSGHSTGAGALAVALVYAAWTVGGRVLAAVTSGAVVALALAIGLSRVYLGVHWPTDVVGGLFLGVFSGSIVVLALEWSGLHVKAGLPS